MTSRRDLFKSAALLAGVAALKPTLAKAANAALGSYTPVVAPNGATLPFTLDNGVKVFHLIAEQIKREIAPGMTLNCWGYNGLTPGPMIEAVEGDRVRILVTNRLPERTTVHWHGLFVPNGMDGIAGLTQPAIYPGETWVYEFTLKQNGTFIYHPHSDETTQMALGMMGFFIVHPKTRRAPVVHRDFAIFLAEWLVPPGAATPDPTAMTDFNLFTFNSRAYPGTAPLVVKTGERVRLRFGNLSMDSHPIHIHGVNFRVTGTDGGPVPPSAQWPETTIDVPPGTTRDVELIADNPGDWPLHCHKAHHAMNQMEHGMPNLVGVPQAGVEDKVRALLPGYMAMTTNGMGGMQEMKMQLPPNVLPMMSGDGPYGAIEMGGMFTVVKIRDHLDSDVDPGWYKPPKGTLAWKKSTE